MKRTHTCGELKKDDVGKEVILQGWVQTARDHGGKIFIDLRDRYGLTQIVFDPSENKDAHSIAEAVRREWVIEAEGKVRPRPKEMVNPNLITGEVEVISSKIQVLNKADTPPIEVDDKKVASDDLRLRWRYLDLRRPEMQRKFLIRHKAAQAARNFLNSKKFLEIETPLLVKSTPEGARDYIVPSRVNAGKFFALPQSPQLYKQILMVSGCDRYYQLARCLRDEDLRADRQPEFTQIDLEMSFVEQEDVFEIIEGVMKSIFNESIGIGIKTPFRKIPYKEAMEKYGSDKPDLRFGLELFDVSEIVKDSDFKVFVDTVNKGGVVKAINAKACAGISRKQIEGEWTEFAATHGAKGLAWMKFEKGKLESSIVKFFSEDIQKKIAKAAKAEDNDLILFVADKQRVAENALGHIRIKVADKLGLLKNDVFEFCWIVDFPMFHWNDEEDRWEPEHHIFTMPQKQWLDKLETETGNVTGTLYDLVLNGVELGSGSIRIHREDIQENVMKVIGLKKADAKKKFGFLLEAFKYGAPPHGGFALGFDRIVALMTGTNDIREVIAFPKNKAAQCPMDNSPSSVDEVALKENHIKLDLAAKAKQPRP
ncbi:aspartate--tRNA ligase, partial [Candidatus Woesearchaeota archaeon]|nr:aspartate--tRNA ligase [Candidatus Woesearchaeota archaeon]